MQVLHEEISKTGSDRDMGSFDLRFLTFDLENQVKVKFQGHV